MKTILYLLCIAMLQLPAVAIGQPAKNCCNNNKCCQVKITKPAITKGFYAIGDNADKLSRYRKLPSCCSTTGQVSIPAATMPSKGYYSIGNNPEKLALGTNHNTKKSVVKKGFYSIGTNADKLNNDLPAETECCSCNCDEK